MNSFENYPIEKIKTICSVFQDLVSTSEDLSKKTAQAGWQQRNALISHVYSNYNQHEELLEAKSKWENLCFTSNVHNKLLDFLRPFRDLYGYFPDYKFMIKELDELIALSIKKEEYEITNILQSWRNRFPDP